MIKVQNNIASREPIPDFLQGLEVESLIDLSWTDPALGVNDAGWWPEEDQSEPLQEYQRYGDETLTPDVERKIVVVTREIVAWSQDEINAAIAEKNKRIYDEIVNGTQKRLDDFAASRNYDGILSACTYATSSVLKFKTEGQYCVDSRDATWAKLYDMLAEIQSGVRPMPTGYADVESELPVLVWPN